MSDTAEFILGETQDEIGLQTAEENRLMSQAMVGQARRTVQILSRKLDPAVYGSAEFADALTRLVARTPYARVQFLVNDTDPIVKHGHKLVELSCKFSSFIQLRRLGEIHRQYNHAFMIVDERGVIYRTVADRYQSECTFNAPRQARNLSRTFQEMWHFGETDPSLIRLHI